MAGAKMRSISTILVRTEQLQLQCSVPLFNREDELSPIGLYQNSTTNQYMTVNPQASLKLKHIDKNKEYDRSAILTITEQTIGGLRVVLDAFYTRFQREDLFGYDEQGRAVEIHPMEGDILTFSLDDKQTLRLKPIIYQVPTKVLNEFVETRPGIGVYINFEQNLSILTMEEFEWLKTTLDRFDFATYGHMLLLEYLILAKNPTEPKPKQESSPSQGIRLFVPPNATQDTEKAKEEPSKAPFLKNQRNPTLDEL